MVTIDTVAEAKNRSLLWGATLCAHAVEGADFDSDWWRFEQRPSHIQGGATSEFGADHLNRFASDLDLAKTLGLNTLQYGVSWARIEPLQGQFDEKSLRHYGTVFRAMAKRGIQPICVLQEHALPAWFSHLGGWEHPDASAIFLAYLTRVHETIGSVCRHWIPQLDPMLWLAMAYGEGCWPAPTGKKSAQVALSGLTRAFRAARGYLREAGDENQVGISIYAPEIFPADPYSPWDCRASERIRHRLQERYPAMVSDTSDDSPGYDFVALSCPGRLGVHLAPWRPRNGFVQFESAPGAPCALDRAVSDEASLMSTATSLSSLGVPLLITGAGVATDDDDVRSRTLLGLVDSVMTLRDQGIDIMGFCYHTFLDGFSWRHGYRERRGLIHVDWKSHTRTPNPSAFLFQDIIRHGEIHPGTVARFAPDWEPNTVGAT